MKLTLAKTTVVVAALVGATVATVSAHAPTAAAAGGPAWPIDTYGTTCCDKLAAWNISWSRPL